jgi:hypothetical protein
MILVDVSLLSRAQSLNFVEHNISGLHLGAALSFFGRPIQGKETVSYSLLGAAQSWKFARP